MASISTTSGCALVPKQDGKPLSSLCRLDFEAEMCWTNKQKGHGIPFALMAAPAVEGEVWFAVDDADLKRIHKGLNK